MNVVYAAVCWIVGALAVWWIVRRYDRHLQEQARRAEQRRLRICREISRHRHPSYRDEMRRVVSWNH